MTQAQVTPGRDGWIVMQHKVGGLAKCPECTCVTAEYLGTWLYASGLRRHHYICKNCYAFGEIHRGLEN